MLKLRIENEEYTRFSSFSIDLEFDAIASTFTFDFYFDPDNENHRRILRPGEYPEAQVIYDQEVIATGKIITPDLAYSSEPEFVSIECYSHTGVLEDCNPPLDVFPLELQKQNLKQIAQKFIEPFNIKLSIDPAVQNEATKVYEKIEADETESIKGFLSNLASQRNIILTHDQGGNLVLTKAKTSSQAIGLISEGQPGVEFSLNFDGQSMHSPITVMGQQSNSGGNASEATVENPLVNDFRPKTISQSSGDNQDTEKAAQNARSSELANLSLEISMDRWKINNQVIKPNTVIKVQSDRLFINEPIDFFIKSVSLTGSEQPGTATINVVLPEVFTGQKPRQIFG